MKKLLGILAAGLIFTVGFSNPVVEAKVVNTNSGETFVTWKCLTMNKGHLFVIEKNVDGEFEPIGVKQGFVTVDKVLGYTFNDKCGDDLAEYRIKTVDENGKVVFTEIIKSNDIDEELAPEMADRSK